METSGDQLRDNTVIVGEFSPPVLTANQSKFISTII